LEKYTESLWRKRPRTPQRRRGWCFPAFKRSCFQLIAVFNQRFTELGGDKQVLHLAAFLLIALATGLIMAPAAYHRQAERGCITRRFVDLASGLLTLSLIPLTLGIVMDAYLIGWLVLRSEAASLWLAGGLFVALLGLWFAMPQVAKRARPAFGACCGPSALKPWLQCLQ
jgi:Family of unknown function (DUF6328)